MSSSYVRQYVEICSGCECDCFLQRCAPLINGLTGQTEHQIDVDVRETCVAQNPKRFFCLLRVVLASEQFQQFVVPRLHAEADPVDSEFFQKRCLSRGDASRICFNRPFNQLR